ncbi:MULTISPECIES: hypothetical protein [Yersinia pseudotuberculosis complex]|uniref:hypothetical protein n=1 Tax=Yersinia pseudotuberculosis complex TaxID=1649845 RepID=UPI0005E09845|nr:MULTISPECIES: hypothetical protein [Yersinia pseudotuberculosis complex]MBO1554574.1 hypothetical protein [Yersinia pseudotuberculosis]CNC37834.1 Uncharacterised protein [Yersinia similis]CNK23981.1 Uncharacterised protein [Yersinia pseudotuberculosis]CRY70840.1 Uncharacterised protein [Yersinia pseudotuberculosis]SUQ18070.1 Uncharacterised protein [Yersinia pseudotuberculosis]
MVIEMTFWEVLSLLLGFISFIFAAGKILLNQIEKRLAERFATLESARKRSEEGWNRLEREFLEFRADLPLAYVRREDYIRGQTVIEAKLDALYSKLEVVQQSNGGQRG